MAGRLISTGISLPEDDFEKIRLLMRGDRRPLGFLVREAVTMYLQARSADIASYAERFKDDPHVHPAGRDVTSSQSKAPGATQGKEIKGDTGDKS
jgi:hypothetical protein